MLDHVQVKVKVAPVLKHHAFLTPAFDAGELSALRLGRFIPSMG
jgi:hypothetical protein